MKNWKRIRVLLMAVVVLALTAPVLLPAADGGAVTAEAATVKINKSKATLVVKKNTTLKVTGTAKKAAWASSNTKVATVGKTTGKVTAKAVGQATITGKIGTKKYTCKVTVIPFTYKTESAGKVSSRMPKAWITDSAESQVQGTNVAQIVALPDAKKKDLITVSVIETGVEAPDFDAVLEQEKQAVTAETQQAAVAAYFTDEELTVDDITFATYKAKLGSLVKITYNVNKGDKLFAKVVCYEGYVDNYCINVSAFDTLAKVSPSIASAAKYAVDTLIIKK